MKHAIVLLTVLSFLWLIGVMMRIPSKRIPWGVVFYLVAHAFFILSVWWLANVLGPDATNNPLYKKAYAVCAIPMIVAMLGVSFNYASELSKNYGGLLVVSAATTSFLASIVLIDRAMATFHLTEVTPAIRNHFLLGGTLLCCGAVTFLSLAAPSGNIEAATKLALGTFWLSLAAYKFSWAIGKVNPYMSWVSRQEWVPTFAALAACAWLALTLSSGQNETSRQPDVPTTRVHDAAVTQVAMQMRVKNQEVA